MTLSEFAYLCAVTAAFVFLGATTLHAVEWASAGIRRHRTQVAAHERELVAAGAPGAEVSGDTVPEPADVSESAAEPDGPRAETPLERSSRFGRMGLALTMVGTALTLVAVVTRGVAAGRIPLANMYEFCSAAMLIVAVAYLVLNLRYGMRFLGLGVNVLLALGMGATAAWFFVEIAPLVPGLRSPWFSLHITAAVICSAAFNLAAVTSILYLLRRRVDQRGGEGYLSRLPSAAKLDRISYWSLAFAFPLWTFTITAGAIWAQDAWGRFWGWDPKEVWALVTWVIYACYLHARLTAGWRTVVPAIIAIVGALSFWFNFIGINLLVSGLHSYAGI